MNDYRTTYRKAMTRAARNAGVWVDAKRVDGLRAAKASCAYLRRTYPAYDWSYWLKPGETVVNCRLKKEGN